MLACPGLASPGAGHRSTSLSPLWGPGTPVWPRLPALSQVQGVVMPSVVRARTPVIALGAVEEHTQRRVSSEPVGLLLG